MTRYEALLISVRLRNMKLIRGEQELECTWDEENQHRKCTWETRGSCTPAQTGFASVFFPTKIVLLNSLYRFVNLIYYYDDKIL